MKRTLVAGVLVLLAVSIVVPATITYARTSKSATPSTPTAEQLREKYTEAATSGKKVRILVMPGHEPNFGGAVYQDVYERELNVEIGNQIAADLQKNPRFEVIMARSNTAWSDDLASYFDDQATSIERFVKDKKKAMAKLIKRGKVLDRGDEEQVDHAAAPTDSALRLYGINKWANENNIDLVVHLHINDAPDHGPNDPSPNSGFAVYVPDAQYGNASTSFPVGQAIASQLSQLNATSTLPIENKGVVEDQDLIALGAYDTLSVPSVLIEYAYITETKLTHPEVRQTVTSDFALLTYRGIQSFFNDPVVVKYPTASLPYTFTTASTVGSSSPATYALQAALHTLNFYPTSASTTPANVRLMAPSLTNCPIDGLMDTCTVNGIEAFQAARGLTVTGTLNVQTRNALNLTFSDLPIAMPVETDSGIGSSSTTPTGSCALPSVTLSQNNTDAKTNGDVSRLQALLAKDKTLYPAGLVTGTFGPATLKAVKAFQAKQGIAKVGSAGSGLVGPQTRAALKALCT